MRGEDHDRAPVEAPIRAQPRGRLVAVDPRHLDVAEDQVGVRGDGEIDPGDAVGRLEHVEPARFQDVAHQGPAFRIVLDVEDARLRRGYLFGHRGTSGLLWGP